MKRPSLALLALLASLAVGLAAISPQPADATTFGELYCAIEIVSPPRHDESDDGYCPDCPYADDYSDECPRVCTPPGTPRADEAYDSAPTADAVADEEVANEQVELNPADTTNVPDSESSWEEEYGRYYGDYFSAEENYSDQYANEYEEATPAEVVIEETAEPTVVEEEVAEEPDFRYGDGYNPWAPVIDDATSAPSEEDLIVEPYDAYGRQVGDDDYGYEVEEHAASDATSDYEYDYSASEEEATEDVVAEDAAEAGEVAEEAAPQEEDYYEEYYPDYYQKLYGSDDDSATNEAEQTDEAVEQQDDLTTEYDAAYDEAVYGESDAGEAVPAEGTAIEVIIEEHAEPTADAESDLPWADEVPSLEANADEETAEVENHPVFESEYGSDYADEYYRALFGEESEATSEPVETLDGDESELEPTEPASDESYEFFESPCHDGECIFPNSFDVTQLAVHCGRQVAAWTASLELVSMRLHSACLQLAAARGESETK